MDSWALVLGDKASRALGRFPGWRSVAAAEAATTAAQPHPVLLGAPGGPFC